MSESSLGYNWDFTYNKYLYIAPSGSVTFYDGKLGNHLFIPKDGGGYTGGGGISATLSQ